MDIRLKRAYEGASADDGTRILVDRLWPRGVSKVKAKLDLWLKDIAPSTELRKWFHQNMDRWPEFEQRYFVELDNNPEPVHEIQQRIAQGRVTLVYAAKEAQHNNAVALQAYLEQQGHA